ncbi:hypothetical protein JHK82_018870 [Glycine max]|nr:hypothetical protein JHK87_018758 [Glycine soja]KAG5022971.1 hypothetical protein JHK85_019313 [Glycine max]KAG5038051.1 hypothetical protein JHK86_018891 [Glycine max]KAG5143175.1 hypothetical protein JHK82_018870 [Glycine max]
MTTRHTNTCFPYHHYIQNGCYVGLELDVEHYVVPTPATAANSAHVYAANMIENPRSLICGSGSSSYPIKEMQVIMLDPSKMFQSSGMVESKSVGKFSPLQKQESQRGLFVDRGVGSPRLVKSSSSNIFSTDLNLDNETKNLMPAATGAVVAAVVADQMLGPKEDRHLAIILVFDKDIGQDKLLGIVKLPLNDLEPETEKEFQLRLLSSLDTLKVKDKKDRGTITIKV